MDLKLKLTTEEAQLIVNALANLPYAQVAGLIPKIMQQAQQQSKQGSDDDAPQLPMGGLPDGLPPSYANGSDRAEG